MKGFGVAVLGILNEEHHEESNDRGGGVDDELPGIGEVENGAEDGPDHDAGESQEKCGGRADGQREPVSADTKAFLQWGTMIR